MAFVFTEFDTNPLDVYNAIKNAVVAGGDWTDISPTQITMTSSGATSGAALSVTDATGIVVGQAIVAEQGTVREERRKVTSVTGNALTVDANWSFSHASGTTFKSVDTVLQCTTTRGAKMIVNLQAGRADTHWMTGSFYRDYTGTAPGGWVDRQDWQLFWKSAAATNTAILHVMVSASANHLFVSIEGPRAHEPSTTSVTYGSQRHYFFLSDLVPYHAADTSPVVVGGAPTTATAAASSWTGGSHQGWISRNYANSASWTPCKLASLNVPTVFTAEVFSLQRTCTIDGNNYLFPYVVFDLAEGIRGRLAAPFYAGPTDVSPTNDFPETIGQQVTFDSKKWRIVAANKGDGTTATWGPLGAATQGTTVRRSVAIALPIATVP
jgi:hypothetical protein